MGCRYERRFRNTLRLLILSLLLCATVVWSQPAVNSSPPAPLATNPEPPKDSLGRTTPRGTVLGFLAAAQKGDYALAAQYMNSKLRGEAAEQVARKLSVVLDRRLPARLNALSDKPEGSLSNSLNPNDELAGTIKGVNGNVDVVLERVDRGKSGPIWLFSSKTLESVPALFEEVNEVSVDSVLPGFLVNTRIFGIVLFEWLAAFVGVPLLYGGVSLLNRVLRSVAGKLLRRIRKRPDLPDPQVLPVPVRILLLAAFVRWLIQVVSLPLLARQFWSSTASIFTVVSCVWLLIIANARVEEHISRRLEFRNLDGTSVLRLACRAVDGVIVFAGVLVALYHFGVNPTAALAGLGIGGLAIAFAAQKTLENLIGGVSIIFDRVISVGDMLKVGNIQGTVDDIGLRSTRIRTLDRTMVSFPNGQIANMSLENLSARDRFWFHTILRVGYETTSKQITAVLEGIRTSLEESPAVDSRSIRVRLLNIGDSSLEIEIHSYVTARDLNSFLEIKEGLLLRTLRCVESAGARIALPAQTVFVAATSTPTEQTGVELRNTRSAEMASSATP